MKIRTDFVTNSSSSSFCIVTIGLKDGTVQEKELYIGEVQNNGFPSDSKRFLEKMTDINELNDFINGVYNQNEDFGMDCLIKDYGFSDIKSIKLVNREDISQIAGDMFVCDSTIEYDYENKRFSKDYIEREFDSEAYYEKNEYVFIDELSDNSFENNEDNDGSIIPLTPEELEKYADPDVLLNMITQNTIGFGVKEAINISYQTYKILGKLNDDFDSIFDEIMNSTEIITSLGLVGCEKAIDVYFLLMDDKGKQNAPILIKKLINEAKNNKDVSQKMLSEIYQIGVKRSSIFESVCKSAAEMLDLSELFNSITTTKKQSNSATGLSYDSNIFDIVKNSKGQYLLRKIKGSIEGEIEIPYGVQVIEKSVFEFNHSITKVKLPDTIVEIRHSAFAWSDIEEIVIPDSVTKMGTEVFCKCENLKKITLSNNLKVIPERMCEECTSLKEVVLTSGNKTISPVAFGGCCSLKYVNFPEGLEIIGECAFEGCISIKEFVAPSSLKEIHSGSFSGCTSLSKIVLNNELEKLGSAFDFCNEYEFLVPSKIKRLDFINAVNVCKTYIIMPHLIFPKSFDFERKEYILRKLAKGYLYAKYVKNICYDSQTEKIFNDYIIKNKEYFYVEAVIKPEVINFFLDKNVLKLRDVKNLLLKKGLPQDLFDKVYSFANKEYGYSENINELADDEKNKLQIDASYEFLKLKNDTLRVEKYTGFEKEIVIPNSFNGKNITVINDCFDNNFIVEKIVFPEHLKKIHNYTLFYHCPSLKEVVYQNGVNKIDLECFNFSSNRIKTVTIPISVESIKLDIEYEYELDHFKEIVFKVNANSYAEEFCKKHNFKYELIDSEGIVNDDSLQSEITEKEIMSSEMLENVNHTYDDNINSVDEEKKSENTINESADVVKDSNDSKTLVIDGENPKKKKGCYIATCVYGSYDCPEVWVLRRYRDNQLSKTWYGRLFIYLYYTISPIIVNLFGNTNWFKNIWRRSLDKIVYNLQEKGFENTEYFDKN